MKWLWLVVAMITLTCMAGDRYRYVWVDESISGQDRRKIKRVIKNKLFERAEVKASDLPRWCRVGNTNVIGRIVCIDAGGRGFKFNVVKMRRWIKNNISITNKVMIFSANSAVEAMAKAGLKVVGTGQ